MTDTPTPEQPATESIADTLASCAAQLQAALAGAVEELKSTVEAAVPIVEQAVADLRALRG